MSDETIAQKYSELLPQLSRSATTCVKLLSSDKSNDKSNWPQGEEYEFHKAFRGFNGFIKDGLQQHQELLQNISVCYREDTIGNKDGSDQQQQKKSVNPIEAVDALFENVDHLLDSLRGVRVNAEKQEEVRIGVTGLQSSANNNGDKNNDGNNNNKPSSSTTTNLLLRPQDAFGIPPDNFAEEFHSFIAVADATKTTGSNNEDAVAVVANHDSHSQHRQYASKPGQLHPPLAASLIRNFEFPQEQLVPPQKDQIFLPLEQTPLTVIDTAEQLQQVVDEKLLAPSTDAIGVDVEHHSDYSYLGFTCLVQISTRQEDFIVDTLKLREEMWRLAPVFHNPKIVKVLHSAQEDIKWLQRDFGLYFINLFDTAIALQTLRMPHSLAFLIDHICQIKLNKQHQTGDWRVRPLPQEMINYARQDTHYLLYCWDRLRTMLATADTRASVGNLLLYVCNESKRLAFTTIYKKPAFDEEKTWKEVFGRSISGLFPHQLKAIQKLFNWREVRARTVDTSPNSIMTNGQLLSVACRLPSTAAEVLRMCNPATVEVRKSVRELLKLLDEARELMVTSSSNNKNNNSNKVQQDAASGAASKTNNNNGAAPIFQPSSVHQPMTGTLPSVQQQHVSSTSSALVSLENNSSSSTTPSSWMNIVLFQDNVNDGEDVETKKKKKTASWTPAQLASTIPVPMTIPMVSKKQQQQNTEQEQQQQQEKVAGQRRQRDEDDEENQNEKQEEAAPEKPSNSANTEQEQQQQSESASSNVINFPKSLAEEHGGLGRQTRKRAAAKKK